MKDKIKYNVRDFNVLCNEHGLVSRVKYDENTEKLLLGDEGQFDYGVYQCIIAEGETESYNTLKALILVHCFEYGE